MKLHFLRWYWMKTNKIKSSDKVPNEEVFNLKDNNSTLPTSCIAKRKDLTYPYKKSSPQVNS